MPRCRSLLTVALPLAASFAAFGPACGPPDETTALRALGTLRTRVALPVTAVAVRVDVHGWSVDGAGERFEAVESRRIEPIVEGAPDDRRDAYALFAVEPGDHRVVATPLDAADRLAPGCAPVEASVTIEGTALTEVDLSPPCEPVTPLAAR